jgi:hypothetical protein
MKRLESLVGPVMDTYARVENTHKAKLVRSAIHNESLRCNKREAATKTIGTWTNVYKKRAQGSARLLANVLTTALKISHES